MTDPVPSKDLSLPALKAWLRERHVQQIAAGDEWTYEELIHAHIERLEKPAHEREMPHCSTCSCPPYEPAPEPAAAPGDSTELYYAEMEASRNEHEHAYFKVRVADDTAQARRTFRAGFERAFAKLWNASRAAQPPRDGQ